MAILKIGSTDLPDPSVLTWDKTDIDSSKSGRNAAGSMLRDRIASKVKLSIEWTCLTAQEMSTVLQAVSDTFFQCTYPDAQTGTNQTKTFYVGDRSSPILFVKDGTVNWKGLKMNFTEK